MSATNPQRASLRDYLWAGFSLLVGIFFVRAIILLAMAIYRAAIKEDAGSLVYNLLVWLPLLALMSYWLGMGAWRRTVWGRLAS